MHCPTFFGASAPVSAASFAVGQVGYVEAPTSLALVHGSFGLVAAYHVSERKVRLGPGPEYLLSAVRAVCLFDCHASSGFRVILYLHWRP